MLTPDIQQAASRSVLCWLATVDAHGQPNVSPKEIFAVFDAQHLVAGDVRDPERAGVPARCLGKSEAVYQGLQDVFPDHRVPSTCLPR